MKNNLWFKHDRGARNDPKIQRSVRIKGAVVKALYWDLIEMLNEEGGVLPIESIDDVTFNNHLDDPTIAEWLVKESGLFRYDENSFWSERQLRDQTESDKLRKTNQENGQKSAEARRERKEQQAKNEQEINDCSTTVQRPFNENGTNGQQYIHTYIDRYNNKDTNVSMSEKISDPEESHKENPLFVQDSPEETEPEQQLLSNKQCQQVVDFWNNTIKSKGANFPRVVSLSEDRKKKIRVRWAEFSKIGDPIEVTRRLFANACESKFLQGDNNNGWSASFDWIFANSKNWIKVYEGNYDNKTAAGKKIDTSKDIEALWEHQ